MAKQNKYIRWAAVDVILNPKECQESEMFTGRSYHDIIAQIYYIYYITGIKPIELRYGFLTNTDEFVEPFAAYRIQYHSKKCDKYLTPEMLKDDANFGI